MQAGMLLVSMYAPDSGAYVQQIVGEFQCDLNETMFREAWKHLVRRHEVLQTRFHFDEATGWSQRVGAEHAPIVELEDSSGTDAAFEDETFSEFELLDRRKGFDFGHDPPSRVTLIRFNDARYRFLWTYHHALLDGRSCVFLLSEFFSLYNSLNLGHTSDQPKSVSYREYLNWFANQGVSHSFRFWQETLANTTSIDTQLKGRHLYTSDNGQRTTDNGQRTTDNGRQ